MQIFGFDITPATEGLIIGAIGKAFVDFAGVLGFPSENCGYWTGVVFDWIQLLAGNKDRAGKRRQLVSAPPDLPK